MTLSPRRLIGYAVFAILPVAIACGGTSDPTAVPAQQPTATAVAPDPTPTTVPTATVVPEPSATPTVQPAASVLDLETLEEQVRQVQVLVTQAGEELEVQEQVEVQVNNDSLDNQTDSF